MTPVAANTPDRSSEAAARTDDEETDRSPLLHVIVCAAGPAAHVGRLIDLAHADGWVVQVIATPAALDFIDAADLEARTGRPVVSRYRKPGQPRLPLPEAIIVAPATFNTINKWANGITDTYALGVLAEAPGFGIPVVVLPFVNSALAGRRAFRRSVDELQKEDVRILLGPGEFEPHPPRSGDQEAGIFPWSLALDEADRLHDGMAV